MESDEDDVVPDLPILTYVAVAAAGALLVLILVYTSRRRKRWGEVLDHVARTLKGRHTVSYRMQLAFIPGSVEAKIDGRSLSVGQESVSSGGSGSDSTTRQRMVVSIGTSQSKPEFLGAGELQPHAPSVADYSGSGGNGELVIGNYRVQAVKMSKKLRKRLAASDAAGDCLAELFATGGVIEHGNVVLRSFKFELDADRLMARIRNMSAVAELID
jgi:hypothetical protein